MTNQSSSSNLSARDLASMATARSGMYDFLAGMCVKPSEKLVTAILNHSLNLPTDASLPAELREAAEAMRNYDPKMPRDDLETALQIEYTKLFRGVTKGYGPPPPYESVYKEGALQGKVTGYVSKTYAQYGVKVPNAAGNLPDYIGMELKFMSVLASKEAEAWGKDRTRALELIVAEKQFVKEHLLSWIPEFCSKAGEISGMDFYKSMMQLFPAVLKWDSSILDDLAETVSNPR